MQSKKKNSDAKKSLNWDKIKKRKISPDMTAEQFVSRIKASPWEIYKFDMRYGIERLREDSIKGTQTKSKIAREILKNAGLQAFIPKRASKIKTDSPKLRSWENHPFYFIQDVESVKQTMRPHWKRLRTGRDIIERKNRNRRCIEALLKQGEKVTDDMLNKLTQGERDKDLTHLALSLLAESNKINFEKLKRRYYENLYYTDQSTKEKKSYLELLKPSSKRKGVLFEILQKTLPPPFELTTEDFYRLLNQRDERAPDTSYPEFIYEKTFNLYSLHRNIRDLSK